MRRIVFYFLFVMSTLPALSQDSVWWARTTGKFPFMEYGIGDDRLGGAKLGYLDSNVLVRIVDSFNTDYKIQLSASHAAYISKNSVVTLFKQAARRSAHNIHLAGNIKTYGDTAYDYVSINLDERWPYHAFQLIDPSRIAVDVYGVTSNTNWIIQLRTTKEIKNTWYEQVEDDVFRVYIQLKHPQHWGYSLDYDSTGRKLVVRVRRQPPVLDIKKLRIAIDAGHGGDNRGDDCVTKHILEN